MVVVVFVVDCDVGQKETYVKSDPGKRAEKCAHGPREGGRSLPRPFSFGLRLSASSMKWSLDWNCQAQGLRVPCKPQPLPPCPQLPRKETHCALLELRCEAPDDVHKYVLLYSRVINKQELGADLGL